MIHPKQVQSDQEKLNAELQRRHLLSLFILGITKELVVECVKAKARNHELKRDQNKQEGCVGTAA